MTDHLELIIEIMECKDSTINLIQKLSKRELMPGTWAYDFQENGNRYHARVEDAYNTDLATIMFIEANSKTSRLRGAVYSPHILAQFRGIYYPKEFPLDMKMILILLDHHYLATPDEIFQPGTQSAPELYLELLGILQQQ